MNITLLFTLLVAFQIKHYLADYPLQGRYMLGKFDAGWSFFFPLMAHSVVHGLMTFCLLLFVAPHLWWLALVDILAHFMMDRVKAAPHYLGRWTHQEQPYWLVLGFDQMFHHLTHYFIIYMVMMG